MKVGFIGLGKMGAGICSNIVKNGIGNGGVYDNPANVRSSWTWVPLPPPP